MKPNTGSFYVRQIIGSTNYAMGTDIIDFSHGFLNYQVSNTSPSVLSIFHHYYHSCVISLHTIMITLMITLSDSFVSRFVSFLISYPHVHLQLSKHTTTTTTRLNIMYGLIYLCYSIKLVHQN